MSSGLIGFVSYDPAVAASKTVAALSAMTAYDTAHLRATFTSPSSPLDGGGKVPVLVRLKGGCMTGATTQSQILLGVLNGSTVMGRAVPIVSKPSSTSSQAMQTEASFLVTGLDPSTSYTWDLAVGVEFAVASATMKYGGPNDSTNNNAYGAASLEVWSCEALLAGIHYDPATVGNFSIAAATPITALDATHLSLTFTAPTAGNVIVRQRGVAHGGTASSIGWLSAVLDGSTILGRSRVVNAWNDSGNGPIATDQLPFVTKVPIGGLTPGQSYTWNAAIGLEGANASANLSWGGLNDALQDNAYGGYSFEIWDAGGAAAGAQSLLIAQVI